MIELKLRAKLRDHNWVRIIAYWTKILVDATQCKRQARWQTATSPEVASPAHKNRWAAGCIISSPERKDRAVSRRYTLCAIWDSWYLCSYNKADLWRWPCVCVCVCCVCVRPKRVRQPHDWRGALSQCTINHDPRCTVLAAHQRGAWPSCCPN